MIKKILDKELINLLTKIFFLIYIFIVKKSIKHSQSNNSSKITLGLIILLIFTAVFLVFKIVNKEKTEKLRNKIIPDAVKKVIGNKDVKITINNLKESSGVFEFELNLNGQKYTSYITKDGKILFTSGIKLDTLITPRTTQPSQKKLTCSDLKKSEKPELTAFIVSQCPYGLQMQRVFKKAIEEIPEIASFLKVKYIGAVENNEITSMHGNQEAQENLKQICIREEQKEKYWSYVSCYMKEGKGDECLVTAGVNQNELKDCLEDNNRGINYAKIDFDIANKFNIGGSPTLLLNNKQIVSEFDFGGRNPEAIKQIICCGSNSQLDFCQKQITKENVTASFSKEDLASTPVNSSGAGCGN